MKVGLLGLMFLILFALKVAGVAQLSWWVVVLPLLAPILIWLAIILFLGILYVGSLTLTHIMRLFNKMK